MEIKATFEWFDANGTLQLRETDDYDTVEDAIGELTDQLALRGRGLGNVLVDGDVVAIVRHPVWVERKTSRGEWRNRVEGGVWQES